MESTAPELGPVTTEGPHTKTPPEGPPPDPEHTPGPSAVTHGGFLRQV